MKKSLLPVAVLLLGLGLAACTKDSAPEVTAEAPANDRTNANARVFPPTAHPYGQSYAEWTEAWWQAFMTYDCATLPFGDGSNAVFGNSGPVYFVGGLYPPGTSAAITIPRGKAMLIPLINFVNVYPCPPGPAPGQTVEEYLVQNAIDAMAPVIDLSVTIDGVPVSNIENYLFVTDVFQATGNVDLVNCFDPCINGASQPTAGSGYYVMLKPLPPGEHTVTYTSNLPIYNFQQQGTYYITVP